MAQPGLREKEEASMSRPAHERKCPDCSGELVPIKLFGRGWKNPLSGAAIDTEVMYYADADAKRSTFLNMFEEAGTVEATLCNDCRRIFLHGLPN
jgi:hypothetical protein